MHNRIRSYKEHVVRYRGRYAALATFLVMMKLQFKTAAEFNAFLKEHDLYEQYYEIGQEF